jgi:hypothetical protein
MEVIAFSVIVVVVYAIVSPFFYRPKYSRHYSCLSNHKQIALGMIMYSNDYDDVLPRASRWMDDLVPYTKNEYMFHDSGSVPDKAYGYAFRAKSSGLKLTTLPDPSKRDLTFDTTQEGRNASSELGTLPNPGRHAGSSGLSFSDGHAKIALPSQLEQIIRDDATAGPKPAKKP